jgi:AcrR family transcriptional regulator
MTARRVDQKQRIRRKAARLFAQNGYDATGIQEISDAVGLGRGALYHHIGSKEQLLFDIITVSVIGVVEEAEALLQAPIDSSEKVRRLSRMMTRPVADNQAEWTVFFREVAALRGPLRRTVLAWRERFEDVWTEVIRQGVASGEFRPVDPVVVKGILGMHNYAHVWLRPRGRLTPDEISASFCELLLAGLQQPDAGR